MITKRHIGTVAALGGFTAAIALLTGLPTAHADELSDLRANQQLLQQRLDQLDQVAALGAAPVAPGSPSMVGSFPRSMLIPGTDTSLAIGGFAVLDTQYYMSGGAGSGNASNDVGEFGRLLSIPVGHAGGGGHTLTMTPEESRVRIETQTPTAWGPAGTVIEFDFDGATNPNLTGGGNNATLHPGESILPRLRLAYGTIGGWLAGQAYTASIDLDSHVDEIDFGGDVSEDGTVRVPVLRYTYDAGNGMSLATSLEDPDTTAWAFGGSAADASLDNSTGEGLVEGSTTIADPLKNNAPDAFESFNWNQPWGHIRLTGLVRDLEFQTGPLSEEFIGYGGWFTGNVLPGWFGWSKDFLGWGVMAGQGIGRYVGNQYDLSTNFGYAGASTVGVIVRPTNSWGGYIGYKHWWADQWASDIAAGIAHTDYDSLLLGSASDAAANKELITTHLNLFWYPTSFSHIGVEWMYGHRQVVNNESGNMSVILGEFMVKF